MEIQQRNNLWNHEFIRERESIIRNLMMEFGSLTSTEVRTLLREHCIDVSLYTARSWLQMMRRKKMITYGPKRDCKVSKFWQTTYTLIEHNKMRGHDGNQFRGYASSKTTTGNSHQNFGSTG